MKKKAAAIVLAITMFAAPMAAYSQSSIASERDDLSVVFDLLIIRPLAYAVMVGGAILYLPAAIITAADGNDLKPVQDTFLKAPYRFAITRPLGILEDED